MAVSSEGYTAPPQNPAEKSDQEKVREKTGRKGVYALVKKIGLERISKKKPLTLKLYVPCDDLLFNLLKVRFQGEKSAIYDESWRVRDSKPYRVKRFKVREFAKLLKRYSKKGWECDRVE